MNIANPVLFGKKKVLLRGPVLTQSGYGVHARQVAKWLFSRPDLDVEVQALPWGDTPWLIDSNSDAGFIGRIMEKTVDPTGKVYDVTVQLQLPNEWDPKLGKVNIGITAGVETDKCHPMWISACNSMSMVVVPSKHAEACLRATGTLTVPVHVVPEAYSPAVACDEKTKIDDVDFSTPFNFLIFGQLTGNNPENDRKNIFYTIKWLCETFGNDEDVGIVLKTNAGRNTCIDRKLVTQTIENLLKQVRKSPFPRVHLVHGDMSDAEVASLYRHPKIKGLVSLTRGEGYGLPILEAAASGLPVIATKWSGHLDFLSHGKYIEVDYKLDAVHPSRVDGKIFVSGSKWAHPNEADFKRKITKFRTSSEIPRDWAKSMQKVILEKYSIDEINKRYNELTKELV
jgi:glycosyltransferase involved in cell wall biosynthesis